MALTCILRGKVLEVRETILSWSTTKRYHWYYDTETWMRSLSGREGARPDYPMQLSEIQWVKRHYLPKAIALEDRQDISVTGRIVINQPQVQSILIRTEEGGRVKKALRPTLDTED